MQQYERELFFRDQEVKFTNTGIPIPVKEQPQLATTKTAKTTEKDVKAVKKQPKQESKKEEIFPFSVALEFLKKERVKLRRSEWEEGRNVYLCQYPASIILFMEQGEGIDYIVTEWNPTMDDMIAEDWFLTNKKEVSIEEYKEITKKNFLTTKESVPFSNALELAKQGQSIKRKGWKNEHTLHYSVKDKGFVILEEKKGNLTEWTPTCLDILASDWEVC